VLRPENVNLKEKDINTLTEEFNLTLHIDTALKIIEDFFTCNSIIFLLKKLELMAGNIKNQIIEENIPLEGGRKQTLH
jgi:hypothetical protein